MAADIPPTDPFNPKSEIEMAGRFLAIFGGMTVVPLGGQTDLLGAGTFWLVNVAARWFLRSDATSPSAYA